MIEDLRAIPLADAILSRARIGFWRVIVYNDKDSEMTGDLHFKEVFGMTGIDLSPEELYRKWFNRIDTESKEIVTDVMFKMKAGEHAEVIFPWTRDNGSIILLRCGGTRKSGTTDCVVLEGTVQDVTSVIHMDKFKMLRLKQLGVDKVHSSLRADALNFLNAKPSDPEVFLNAFSERLRSVFNCDQFDYSDDSGLQYVCNGPDMDDVDFSLPPKSSLECVITLFGRPYGRLVMRNYLTEHEFNDYERDTLDEFGKFMTMMMNRYVSRKQQEEMAEQKSRIAAEEKKRAENIIQHLTQKSMVTFLLNTEDLSTTPLKVTEMAVRDYHLSKDNDYRIAIREYIDEHIYPDDRAQMYEASDINNLKETLHDNETRSVSYRTVISGRPMWVTFNATRISPTDVLISFTNTTDVMTRKAIGASVVNDTLDVYYCYLDYDVIVQVKNNEGYIQGGAGLSKFSERMKELAGKLDVESRPLWEEFCSAGHLQAALAEDKRTERMFLTAGTDGPKEWIKAAFYCVEKNEGVPCTLVLIFSNVDKEQVENIKLNQETALQKRQLEEDLKAIRGLANEYATLSFIDLLSGKSVTFKRDETMRNLSTARGAIWKENDFFSFHEAYMRAFCHKDFLESMLKYSDPEHYRTVLMNKKRATERFKMMNAGGEYRWYDYVVLNIEEGSSEINRVAAGFVHVDKEVRMIEEHQRALEEARKAQEASKLKSQFVQNISHDIRTPLNAIVGFSQILGMEADVLSEDEREEFTGYITDSAEMLTMLVDDVLNVSDVENGILKIEMKDCQCNEICRKAVHCSTMRVLSGVKLYYTSEVEDGYTLYTDGKRVQQILVNFLSNACKHTEQGEIHVHCSTTEHEGSVTFSVTDTGTGVSPEIAEIIFQRFSSQGGSESHGLGLDICRDLSERLGGYVSLDRSYTDGARFILVLPIKQN